MTEYAMPSLVMFLMEDLHFCGLRLHVSSSISVAASHFCKKINKAGVSMASMELTFRHALFAAGAALIIIGAVSLIADVFSSAPDPGVLEAFSRGFDTIFLALFSGVLIGIGMALVGNGLLLHLLGNKKHILVSALFSLLFLALSTLAVFFRDASPLFAIVGFFAFICASFAFLLTSLWYALSSAARKYLLEIK